MRDRGQFQRNLTPGGHPCFLVRRLKLGVVRCLSQACKCEYDPRFEAGASPSLVPLVTVSTNNETLTDSMAPSRQEAMSLVPCDGVSLSGACGGQVRLSCNPEPRMRDALSCQAQSGVKLRPRKKVLLKAFLG
jgi:hypothetical protein